VLLSRLLSASRLPGGLGAEADGLTSAGARRGFPLISGTTGDLTRIRLKGKVVEFRFNV